LSSTINIKIQGREYSLRSQESEEQTQRVVEFVEQKMDETAAGRSVDTRDLTVLTLLNIAGQYLHLKDELNDHEDRYRERLEILVERLTKDNSGC
jgi:cell division protein ZapA (FtsZ GTPase activity inhibitor)